MSTPDCQVETQQKKHSSLTMGAILQLWVPLAASWLMMSTETPIVTAVAARMPNAKLQLAGFGIAYSLALMAESPVLAMLTTGNALARDRDALRLVQRFMLILCAIQTAVMVLLAFTPLSELIVVRLIGAPPEIAAVARRSLVVMLPWPAAIAYRRFYQGIMIRCGHTRWIGFGTALRLVVTLGVAVAGMLFVPLTTGLWSRFDGGMVAGMALGCAVLAEALFIHYASRPAVRRVLEAPPSEETLSVRELARFYAPLTLTSMIMLSTTPMLSFGMARSPYPVESLAVWPVVNGQMMQVRSFGFSLQEVIVALLDRGNARRALRRFSILIGLGTFLLLASIAFTPIGPWYQRQISGLAPDLISFAMPALRLTLLVPVLATVQSWLRGIIVVQKRTAVIAGAIGINLVVLMTALLVGAKLGRLPGASLAAIALTIAQLVESVWLWRGAYVRSHRAGTLERA